MFEKIFNHLKVDLKDNESFSTQEIPFRCDILTGENITVSVSYNYRLIESDDLLNLLGTTYHDYFLNVTFNDHKHNERRIHDVLFVEGKPFFVGTYDHKHKGDVYKLAYMFHDPTVFTYNDTEDIDIHDKTVQFDIDVSNDTKMYNEFKAMIAYLNKHYGL